MEYPYQDEELEEIEARLYSEAYHSKVEDDFSTVLHNEQNNLNEAVHYFQYKNSVINSSANYTNSCIPLENSVQIPVIQNNITVIPPNNINVPNNITLNQYTVPILEILPPLNNSKFFTSWIRKNQYLINQKLPNKHLRKKAGAKKRRRQDRRKKVEVISLLDDSEEECNAMPKIEEKHQLNIVITEEEDDDDDDIIYIPPPPQEIINIDDEIDTIDQNETPEEQVLQINKSPNDPGELPNESSNDFLENTTLSSSSNNFNFSLHGSDFNNGNQSEFVQPDNPSQSNDLCETESSTTCSNDHNTEFNNSVKTIVFSEVEFPKGDIFSEKNLETFGSLITPKRFSNITDNDDSYISDNEQSIHFTNAQTKCNKALPYLSHIPLNIENSSNSKKDGTNNDIKTNKKSIQNNAQEQKSASEIMKKNKKKKKKYKRLQETIDKSVFLETGRNKQKRIATGAIESSDESVSSKQKKSSENLRINNQLGEKNNSKRKKPRLPNFNNDNIEKTSVDDKAPTVQSIDSAKEETTLNEILGDDINDFSDIIVIDEVNESDSDVEIIDTVVCINVEADNVDDLQVINFQQNEFSQKVADPRGLGVDFDIALIQKTQSDDPEKWQILDKDKIMLLGSNAGPRCLRCKHSGHKAKNCTEKFGPPKCSLCGDINHYESRCPNKICRQCGNKGDYSTSYCWSCFKFRNSQCHLCGMTGHISKTCPDLWRRYHLTTEAGPLVRPERSPLKPKSQWWCSGCAKQGHLEHECKYCTRAYPPTTPFIVNYKDVLNDDSNNFNPEPDISRDKKKNEMSSLSDTVSNPKNSLVSQNIPQSISEIRKELSNTDYKINTYLGQPLINMAMPNTICLQHNDGLPQPVFDVTRNAYSNQSICLHFENGIPQPNYKSTITIPLKQSDNLPVPDYRNIRAESNDNTTGLQYETPVPPIHQCPIEDSFRNNSIPESTQNDLTLNPFILPNNTLPEILHSCEQNVTQTKEIPKAENLQQLDIKKKLHASKNIIMSMPSIDVKKFLRQELSFIENKISTYNPRQLKNKFYQYDKLWNLKNLSTKSIKEKRYWFHILNMYIFGVHKFKDGNLHINNLREYLANSKTNDLNGSKRKSLFSSYSYIFGYEKHVNISYQKIMKILIQQYDEGKINKPLL